MKFSTISSVVLALVSVVSTASADPKGGEFRDTDLLRPGTKVTYTHKLNAVEPTAIRVIGDGDGDIDCAVIDDNNNIVAKDISSVDGCYLEVNPKWPAEFKIVIANNGDEASLYAYKIW